ncbi:hypothetical protein J6590_088018 [Homalodisca vitripennis]|nr:hypothetical protein J6590_088018 [Homalodisca vitripennis]
MKGKAGSYRATLKVSCVWELQDSGYLRHWKLSAITAFEKQNFAACKIHRLQDIQ